MGQLVHKEDIYALDIGLIKNFDDIIVKLNEDGYKMGKLSLMALVNGEVDQACGFSYEEGQEWVIDQHDRLMESISQLKAGQIVLTATPIGNNFIADQYIKKNTISLNGWNKRPIKVSISSNKREGHYCGPEWLGIAHKKKCWIKSQKHTRKGNKTHVVALKDIHGK